MKGFGAMDMEAKCCKPECEKAAEYEVREIGTGKMEDHVHACLEHIPELMTDASVHEVVRLVSPGDPSPVYR